MSETFNKSSLSKVMDFYRLFTDTKNAPSVEKTCDVDMFITLKIGVENYKTFRRMA